MALVGRSPSTRGRSVARSLGLGVRASRAWPCGRSSPVALRRSLGEGTGSLFGRMSSALAPKAAASAAIRNVRFIVLSKGKGGLSPSFPGREVYSLFFCWPWVRPESDVPARGALCCVVLSGLTPLFVPAAVPPAAALPEAESLLVLAPAAVVSLSDLVLDCSILRLFFLSLLLALFDFGVSALVDAPAAALRSALVSVEVLAPAPAVPGLALTSAFVLASVFGVVVVLWAAASWLNETASRPEKRAGKNLRISVLLGVGKKVIRGLRAKRVPGTPLAPCAVRRVVMRKLLVLALAAASFS